MVSVWIQIRIWLMQNEVRKFVGFVSAVVGLVCYAVSSSFNHLFGEWKLFKILLYIVFSFILCFTTLFPKVLECSWSLLLKAHMAVLVVIGTSLYSFFYDKAVSRKPDAYILISDVAFAVMSLSLSVDLVYFFLGFLIIQLMKINMLLGFVGASFSYFLLILRSSLDNVTQEDGDFELEDIQVHSRDTDSASSIMTLEATPNTNVADIMPQLMVWIDALKEREDMVINKLDRIPIKQLEVTDHNFLIDLLPSGIVNGLHETVKLMVTAGFEKECCDLYSSCRRGFLQRWMSSKWKEMNLLYKTVEYRTDLWSKAFYTALRAVFPGERRLCDRVFFGLSSATVEAADLSVMEACKELTIDLLNFLNDLEIGSPSLERFRSCLEVVKTLRDLIPEFESLFSVNSASLKKAIKISKRFEEEIRVIYMELEKRISFEMELVDFPNDRSGVDSITFYVISILRVVLEHKGLFPLYPDWWDNGAIREHFGKEVRKVLGPCSGLRFQDE